MMGRIVAVVILKYWLLQYVDFLFDDLCPSQVELAESLYRMQWADCS